MSVTGDLCGDRHNDFIDGSAITGIYRVAEGCHMTMLKAFSLAFSLFLMSLGLLDPSVLSTPTGF